MTAASLAHLPVAAGGVVLSQAGRATLWAAGQYMRAPLANTGILALLTLTTMAGSNALYMQRHHHPAPLFSPVIEEAAVEPEAVPIPVIPATRRRPLTVLAPLPGEETTGSVDRTVDADAIGNAEVSEIQRRLHAMQIYDGAIDGLFGPRTARAIRAFEERMGLPPKGQVTVELLEAVRAAPVILPEAEIEPLPTPDPLPEIRVPSIKASPTAETQAATEATTADATAFVPLPKPAPLVIEARPRAALRRQLPDNPREAMELVADTAGDAIDAIASGEPIEAIINGVQSIAMTTPRTKKVEPAATATEPARDEIQTASIDAPRVGVPLENPDAQMSDESAPEVAVLDTDAQPEDLMPAFSVNDPVVVAKVQRGLASLGFLHGPADGIAGEATAKAIRNFEVYYNYKVTGRISPELLDLLVANGASI
jgi:peptidoglycan hydrolase-like protein with peptidoglycan-binding domain